MSYLYVEPNQVTNNLYSGQCYAFGASGGFNVLQGFDKIALRKPDLLSKYDVTDAIQLKFSTRTLNKKLSIIKDASNQRTVQAWFDPISDRLQVDNIKLCTCDLIDGINTDSILSIGKLENLYYDFRTCVLSYFGDPGGFASLFSGDQDFQANGGVFDASAFIQVVNSYQFNMQGSYVSDLSGYATVSDINKLLEFVIDSNVFGNRNPGTRNWGIIDGFVAGDLVFIPTGFTISLSIDIESETFGPINNIGPQNLHAIRNRLNWTRGYVNRVTTSTLTNITQTTTLPILLILVDETIENYTNYGRSWSLSSISQETIDNSNNPFASNNNWLAISLSATGQYQSLINATGDVVVTNSYGLQWSSTLNIGSSFSNSIAISFTGMHQTVSNGHVIYVSSDYGETWTPTYNAGTSNIFVSISLSGRYQTLVSTGDNVYTSDDFGNTWSALNDDTDLYQSVQTFPTGGIALSYTGQYQTIVVEAIYISDDFGRTWTGVSDINGFDDRNWAGIGMSSDGIYQTAIENGGEIHISSDYGKSWLFVDDVNVMDKEWQSVSVSATGQYQTALEANGNIFTSNDYGKTWSQVQDILVANKSWQMVEVSSDALYQFAIEAGGKVYTSMVHQPLTDVSGNKPCVCL